SILKTNGILEKSELEHLDTDVWRSSRCYLAELSTEELMRLAAYYRLVGTLNILIDLYPGVMPPQVRNHFEKGFLMAQAVLHLLGIYWDVKNVRCHVESYRQLFARIDREYLRCPP
ncbi:MAG: hypothetical protein IKN43_11745, partial [Selenomonadaceae bacterium]|nr:hypothetical protein [Selenomonadaceae bacterium]